MEFNIISNPRIDDGQYDIQFKTNIICSICNNPSAYYIKLETQFICKSCCSDMIEAINIKTLIDIPTIDRHEYDNKYVKENYI